MNINIYMYIQGGWCGLGGGGGGSISKKVSIKKKMCFIKCTIIYKLFYFWGLK